MDDAYRYEIQRMRRQSRYGAREDGKEEVPLPRGFCIRSFLAAAFAAACVGFSLIPDSPIPEPLKHMDDQIRVNYTSEDLDQWMIYWHEKLG